MKRTLSCLILLMTIGCSQSPTAPTSSSPSIAAQLNWNVTSATCAPFTPPPSQPAFSAATITEKADGSVTASWPYLANNRTSILYATFVRENGGWAMCSWDLADV